MPSVPSISEDRSPSPLTVGDVRLCMLIYGEYGRGKSTLAATFPKPIVLDTNGGLISLALEGVVVDTFVPTGYEDLEAFYYWVKQHTDEYETIIVDTFDSLAALTLDEIVENAADIKKQDNKRVMLRMEYVPEIGDHYANQRQMRRFLTELRRLGKHIVVTCGQRSKGGVNGPDVSNGMENVLLDWTNLTGELVIIDESQIDGDELPDPAGDLPTAGCRLLWTEVDNTRSTRSKIKGVTPYIVEPTFDKIWSLIEAQVDAANSGTTAAKRAAERKG